MNLITNPKIESFLRHYILKLFFDLLVILLPDQGEYRHPLSYTPLGYFIYIAVILAPAKETLLYQFLPKFILDKLGVKNKVIVILLLAIPFSLLHDIHQSQDLFFSIFFTVGCIILVHYYIEVQETEDTRKAILKTILLHGLHNFTLIFIDIIFFKQPFFF